MHGNPRDLLTGPRLVSSRSNHSPPNVAIGVDASDDVVITTVVATVVSAAADTSTAEMLTTDVSQTLCDVKEFRTSHASKRIGRAPRRSGTSPTSRDDAHVVHKRRFTSRELLRALHSLPIKRGMWLSNFQPGQ